MPHKIAKTVYYFNELCDEAKEKARNWYREGAFEWDWHDCVFEDAISIGAILGIEITRKTIFFSGFWSQGDGACFEGNYSYSKGWKKALKGHAPLDEELLRIGQELQKAQKSVFYTATAHTLHRGHYNHSGCMEVSVDVNEEYCSGLFELAEEGITQALRDFADWIYSQLEKQYEWMNSDEMVDETILANEYEFDKEGNRSC